MGVCLWVVIGGIYFSWQPVRRQAEDFLGLPHQLSVTPTAEDAAFSAASAIDRELCGLGSIQVRAKATSVREIERGRVEVTGTAIDCRKGDGTIVRWVMIYAMTAERALRPSMVKVGDEVLLFDP